MIKSFWCILTILPLCSKEFLNEYNKSDLIIAKGQGNYEALSDEDKNIFFLLKIKCTVIAESFNGRYKSGDIVVDRYFNNVKKRL
ncbi:MAG: ARMT1-like domain-containing protein [Candidatus Humimicrobiaceae bacterium]